MSYLMKKYDYKKACIYVDKGDNLIGVPFGESKFNYLKALNLAFPLEFPYDDNTLEQFLIMVLNKSHSIHVDEESKSCGLAQYLGVKSYDKAEKNRKVIQFFYTDKDGYSIIPTQKGLGKSRNEKGYRYNEEDIINLGLDPQVGELAKAFYKAVTLSTTDQ